MRTDNSFLALVADYALDDVTERRRARRARAASRRARSRATPSCSSGSARSTRPRRGRRRCAPARCCSRAAGLLEGKEATTHWASLDRLRDYGAIPTGRARRRAGQDHHRRRRVVGHRHGAHARRAHRRRRVRAGDPARHRVRPAAAVRLRIAGEGAARPSPTSCGSCTACAACKRSGCRRSVSSMESKNVIGCPGRWHVRRARPA